MYDQSGGRVWQGELDSFGAIQNFKGDAKTDCPFRYQGQYEDAETGLYYNRFRYYSPEEGVYLSQDPIGLEGGLAFYGYVHDVNDFIDPFGLSCKKVKELLAGNDITVKSFKEADRVLFEAFPNARKVRGAGPKPYSKVSKQKKSFKLKPADKGNNAVYHKDYLHNPKDPNGSLFGHEELPIGHPHKTIPHINVLTPQGDKVVIYITK